MLSKKQFTVLVYLATHSGKRTQREIAEKTGISCGTVNRILRDFQEQGFLATGGGLSPAGLQALEPYRVKRAVFIAAGFGSRMVPVTLNTPKPLVRVKGVRIIETLLDAVLAAGIEEIYIVRGYLKEQFDQLLHKYPMLRFIDNPVYNEANTISSVLCAGDRIRSAYLLESDLMLKNPALIQPYQYQSNYLGVPLARTDDYYVKLKGGYISEFGIGGTDCYQVMGISFWSEEDGARVAECVRQEYAKPGGKERTFGSIPLTIRADEFRIGVRECSFDDIVEIDTFNELKAIDPAYGKVWKAEISGEQPHAGGRE